MHSERLVFIVQTSQLQDFKSAVTCESGMERDGVASNPVLAFARSWNGLCTYTAK